MQVTIRSECIFSTKATRMSMRRCMKGRSNWICRMYTPLAYESCKVILTVLLSCLAILDGIALSSIHLSQQLVSACNSTFGIDASVVVGNCLDRDMQLRGNEFVALALSYQR